MKPTIAVVRAIGAEFTRRALKPMLITGLIVGIVLLAVGGWLITKSAWWWIFEVICICAMLIFLTLAVSAQFIVSKFAPQQSREQKQAVGLFVDKLERVAENLQTPQFVILFRVVRDIVRPPSGDNESFIVSVSRESKSLKPDFEQLRRQFDN